MGQNINVFLPMRLGSERIPQKNTKNFSGIDGGLCKIKINQLIRCQSIEKVYVSTNDPDVVSISNSFNSKKIKVIIRPDELASSLTSTDELIKYVPEVMPEGYILWTHVTSPFINSDTYYKIIDTYQKNLNKFDSLMTVSKIKKFIWNDYEPLNYDRNLEKWPRTQTLKPLWEVNSGAFLASKDIYKYRHDRIGNTPYLYQLNDEIAFDIDWLEDFKIAEALYYSKYCIPKSANEKYSETSGIHSQQNANIS